MSLERSKMVLEHNKQFILLSKDLVYDLLFIKKNRKITLEYII